MIAKEKKPYYVGKTLIKPCMSKAAGLVLGKKMAKISLSDSAIKTLIDELVKDIECQVLKKLQPSLFFSIQCDKTTDIAQMSQLLLN